MTRTKIFVAGHRGMVGSANIHTLLAKIVPARSIVTHTQLDMCSQHAVQRLFSQEQPTQVYLAAAKLCGVYANNTYLGLSDAVLQAQHNQVGAIDVVTVEVALLNNRQNFIEDAELKATRDKTETFTGADFKRAFTRKSAALSVGAFVIASTLHLEDCHVLKKTSMRTDCRRQTNAEMPDKHKRLVPIGMQFAKVAPLHASRSQTEEFKSRSYLAIRPLMHKAPSYDPEINGVGGLLALSFRSRSLSVPEFPRPADG